MSTSPAPKPATAAAGRYTLDPRVQIRYLLNEWRLMFQPSTILTDSLAGVAVALVALPLSLAIANASGVPPEIGLITAIIGGLVVGFFGGCRLQVSGPAAAMTFLVYEIITKFGMSGLIVATLIAGALQVISGVFRLGRFMQFIPRPVVAGFLTGIGLTILSTQLSVVLGYDVTHDEEGGAISLLIETFRQIGQTNWMSVVVGLTAMGIMLGLPRLTRKLPTPLVAVVSATLLPILFGWTDLKLLGELPRSFPMPTIPRIPWNEFNELILAGVTVYFLASIESLLSAAVVDSMVTKKTRLDNDQELVGQGLGNIASALFGGIPVTGVIARSATNIQAGAQTRLSALIHTVILLASMFFLSSWVALIPLAALAGVLSAVAFRMIEIHMLRVLWRVSRPEAIVFLVTAGAIVVTDLINGVQIGLLATVLYFVYEMSKMNIRSIPLALPMSADEQAAEAMRCPNVLVMDIEGPLFFGSGFHMRNMISRLDGSECIILDVAGVSFLDMTGAEILDEEAETLQHRGVEVVIARPSTMVRQRLADLDPIEFPAIQNCQVFDTLVEAMKHADLSVEKHDRCHRCRSEGRCLALEEAMKLSEGERLPGEEVGVAASSGTDSDTPA